MKLADVDAERARLETIRDESYARLNEAMEKLIRSAHNNAIASAMAQVRWAIELGITLENIPDTLTALLVHDP